jgi:hypothetical protein
MEKPTSVIQKIIESLQQINTLDFYSPIEKDIILHNLRAAYIIFLNIPVETKSLENRVQEIVFEENEESEIENEELEIENEESEIENEESEIENEEDSLIEEIEEVPLVKKAPLVVEDDLLELIPDVKPQTGLFFNDMNVPKPEKKSLNDLLTEKKDDQTLGARFQQSGISDLTKAIAINEKFTFIRELFHNSGVDFSNAIQKLNECKNLDTAFILIEELKHQYLWDTTSTSYLLLCDLVRRRFL